MDCDVTYRKLARYAASELESDRTRAIEEHLAVCESCRRRLRAVQRTDAALLALPRLEPSPQGLLNTRRALSQHVRGSGTRAVMTLDEVADYLRISLDELEEIVLELPVFELAGQLRVRRAKLDQWLEARERAFARAGAESEVARILTPTP